MYVYENIVVFFKYPIDMFLYYKQFFVEKSELKYVFSSQHTTTHKSQNKFLCTRFPLWPTIDLVQVVFIRRHILPHIYPSRQRPEPNKTDERTIRMWWASSVGWCSWCDMMIIMHLGVTSIRFSGHNKSFGYIPS